VATVYHVAKHGSDRNPGTEKEPFLTINKAASVARAGDTVIVHEGEYREWVKPKHSGLSEERRITYKAADGEKVVIKGSERIRSWQKVDGTVWKAVLPNALFGDFNPFREELFGDWLVTGHGKHLGDVYLNGKSFHEAGRLEDVFDPAVRTEIEDHWTGTIVPVLDPEQTKYVWYAEAGDETTVIYANFHGADPNEELVEINVRRSVFYPEHPGINYITVSGFEMAHAATPWSPPTADQPGLIGPHWSKGWIIENNIIHDAKCSAVSLGKEISTGHNFRSLRKDKPGYHYQIESVFLALQAGWSKEKIGSHIVRNNTIYNCGQNGVVGHLGCAFSRIEGNHIFNIGIKREFYGHEIAGIKLHAAIDVQIVGNRIHDCSLGTWLDWQAQGTRVSRNVYYRNSRDLFVEVSHGPYLVDHNIFTAAYALDNHAQGGAYVNNLICGSMKHLKMLDRATPYHFPHSTQVKGFAPTYGGDDRFFGNVFVGGRGPDATGTVHYDGYPASLEEYIALVDGLSRDKGGDHYEFNRVEQPVYINGNVYLNGAKPYAREEANLVLDAFDPKVAVSEEQDGVYLTIELPEAFEKLAAGIHSTRTLPRVRLADADYENPDGSAVMLDTDLLGNRKPAQSVPGPIATLGKGKNRVKVWG